MTVISSIYLQQFSLKAIAAELTSFKRAYWEQTLSTQCPENETRNWRGLTFPLASLCNRPQIAPPPQEHIVSLICYPVEGQYPRA